MGVDSEASTHIQVWEGLLLLFGGGAHKQCLKSLPCSSQPYRIFNTWMGDPSKNVFLSAVLSVIKTERLLEEVARSGAALLHGLGELQVPSGQASRAAHSAAEHLTGLCISTQTQYPHLLNAARGLGTFCAIDACDAKTRDGLIQKVRDKGRWLGACRVCDADLTPVGGGVGTCCFRKFGPQTNYNFKASMVCGFNVI